MFYHAQPFKAAANPSPATIKRREQAAARKQKKKDEHVAKHAELVATLTELANIPAPACPACKSTEAHFRCCKCGVCSPIQLNDCGDCGAKRISAPYGAPQVREWRPKKCFAATFANDLLSRIKNGVTPSEKQIALANKLAAEDHTTPKTSGARPMLQTIVPFRKSWKAVQALAETRFVVSRRIDALIVNSHWAWTDLTKEEKAIVNEACKQTAEVAARIIEDATGYAVLVTADEYADALRACAGDKLLYNAVAALSEEYGFYLREARLVESPCRHGHNDCLRTIDGGIQPNHAVAYACREQDQVQTPVNGCRSGLDCTP